MSQAYLINLTTIKQFEDLSANIKPERILGFIKKAQELDLKPLLGRVFYNSIITQLNAEGNVKDDASESIINLINGCNYTDKHQHQINYEGIIPTLVYFTLARFIEGDAVRYSASGPVLKNHESSQALSWADTVKIAQQYRSIANAHANEVEKYLWDNQSLYPLWQFDARNKNSRQPGARISTIDKTRLNFPLENTDPLITYNQWL
ncbi:DUF6712 family protein [Mucilaginibacter sp. KACC 22063]|uniref:DUF6712 family protein n=1 Tax=Mucilaginibacter sp. KACC 22063 TaxID=3025666 RepID=UPI0023661E6B|nr:hypothetical protein [Mucilaginibacter sp. KACC 22063]WDF54663.1 hypothetical protein PQ461_17155 [Mucilaginibacter sp. KACC 22063]